MVHSRSFRFWSSWSLVLLALPLSGCTGMIYELINDNRMTWLWATLPLAGFAFAGGILAHWRRLIGLEAWRLDHSPSLPASRKFYVKGLLIGLATLILFGVVNFLGPYPNPQQIVLNLLSWSSGAFCGIGLGIYLGIHQAEKKYAVQIHPEVAR